jgi:hypothetical protein
MTSIYIAVTAGGVPAGEEDYKAKTTLARIMI